MRGKDKWMLRALVLLQRLEGADQSAADVMDADKQELVKMIEREAQKQRNGRDDG
jgi:hypothetical protein